MDLQMMLFISPKQADVSFHKAFKPQRHVLDLVKKTSDTDYWSSTTKSDWCAVEITNRVVNLYNSLFRGCGWFLETWQAHQYGYAIVIQVVYLIDNTTATYGKDIISMH
jgi:hypothetical protein